MKTVKAKQTIAGGSYNRLLRGETAELKDKEANDLVKAGLVDIVSDGGDDADESKEKEKPGFTITDNTNKDKEKKEVLVKDEKKTDAGPNAPKDDKKK